MRLLFILALFPVLALYASDDGQLGYHPQESLFSKDYVEGPFLIYDCEEKHWACVQETNFYECKVDREKELLEKDDPNHSCAPIGLFPTKKSCTQRQLFLTTQNYSTGFCIK